MLAFIRPALGIAFLLGSLAACSGGGTGDDGSGASGGSGGAGASGGSGSASGGGGSGGAGGGGALGGPFRYGVNYGFPNPGWNDQDLAFLSHEAGANSARLKLSEGHLATWGYEIEVGDMKGYESLGMGEHVAFLGAPTAEHSTAPGGIPSWELEHYIPKNLYEPVFKEDGSINPNNYWGAYVYQTVTTYKPWVRVWEVWNEPDWVSDWQVTQTWDTEPPTKEQLVRFGGSIYDYVRMLRVSFEAAKKADPEARIALGGIGYPNFLSAVLRYTDNPSGGAVTNEYPKTGSSYFDVVSFHYYPVFGPETSDDGVAGFLQLKSELEGKLTAAGVTGKGWIVTETGGPHVAVGGAPGGADYAPNYLAKVMVAAQSAGIERVDWFCLSDGKPVGESTNAFDYMGLYVDVSKLGQTSEAVRTEAGRAYRTLSKVLEGARYDTAGTTALALPGSVGGAAFKLPDMRRAVVLWARATEGSETANGVHSFAAEGPYEMYALDWSETGTVSTLDPVDGKITTMISDEPWIFVQKP
ncbi:hypothetical protein [Polyangium sp. 6x1]|uniref:hypothetical protein n=1 Tax=Polyangium sp. 6x1 TaxID=3042689 RepID=UPI002482BF11|nr:hypothetical protein [Polyangium sp. 6x1]MDI1443307.1 hypothetical protein [Polyangium sp. 6x1]